jgi:hypothetical protein
MHDTRAPSSFGVAERLLRHRSRTVSELVDVHPVAWEDDLDGGQSLWGSTARALKEGVTRLEQLFCVGYDGAHWVQSSAARLTSLYRVLIFHIMKTSVDIDDHLFARVKEIADESGLTVRAMIESGLQFVVREHGKKHSRYMMPDARFSGTPGFAPGASEEHVASALREMNDELAAGKFK